jgi:16S rRNA (cytidine1402-2'-O)-methyltransferase
MTVPTGTGVLYVVPTPIGNLNDITLRAIKCLKEADVILAEDTRHSSFLLKYLGIDKKLQAYHQHNEHELTLVLISRLKLSEKLALISDAGTPGISDAGFLLVRECIRNQIPVQCLPGATAFVPALIVSGFPTNEFLFAGFLPQKKGRQKKISELLRENRPVILYESPNRLIKLLEEIKTISGESRLVSVSRELTKIHEETVRGTVGDLILHFRSSGVKGEIVVVINPANVD